VIAAISRRGAWQAITRTVPVDPRGRKISPTYSIHPESPLRGWPIAVMFTRRPSVRSELREKASVIRRGSHVLARLASSQRQAIGDALIVFQEPLKTSTWLGSSSTTFPIRYWPPRWNPLCAPILAQPRSTPMERHLFTIASREYGLSRPLAPLSFPQMVHVYLNDRPSKNSPACRPSDLSLSARAPDLLRDLSQHRF